MKEDICYTVMFLPGQGTALPPETLLQEILVNNHYIRHSYLSPSDFYCRGDHPYEYMHSTLSLVATGANTTALTVQTTKLWVMAGTRPMAATTVTHSEGNIVKATVCINNDC